MKLIIRDGRIVATGTDAYRPTGDEDAVIDAPDDFGPAHIDAYIWQDGALVPRVPPAITRRQLLLGLQADDVITDAEALAAAQTGAVPAAIESVFANLPATEATAARITWATMSVAERAHPLIAAIIDANLASAAQIDDAFRRWAAL
jgi:hypothetical protein